MALCLGCASSSHVEAGKLSVVAWMPLPTALVEVKRHRPNEAAVGAQGWAQGERTPLFWLLHGECRRLSIGLEGNPLLARGKHVATTQGLAPEQGKQCKDFKFAATCCAESYTAGEVSLATPWRLQGRLGIEF